MSLFVFPLFGPFKKATQIVRKIAQMDNFVLTFYFN